MLCVAVRAQESRVPDAAGTAAARDRAEQRHTRAEQQVNAQARLLCVSLMSRLRDEQPALRATCKGKRLQKSDKPETR